MKVIVRGSTGLIGRPLVASLHAAGHDVDRRDLGAAARVLAVDALGSSTGAS